MITSRQWDDLVFTRPFNSKKRKLLSKIVGLDSETYTTGEPFMFCTSEGDVFTPSQIPAVFFTPKYTSSNFVLYNLKFDVGSILRACLPHKEMFSLWQEGLLAIENGENVLLNPISAGDYSFSYIPHKQLVIKYQKEKITFWDISQFYQSSLDYASQKYLSRKKLNIRSKHFFPAYARHCWKSISRYCIQDATLTRDLALYLIKSLAKLDITVTNLYSCASISHQYFKTKSKISDVWQLYNYEPAVLKMACDAYEGGKFEVTVRGYFPHVYEYDITSAYPYEISNLVSLKGAFVYDSPQYQSEAVYGFVQCRIINNPFHYLPCGLKSKETKNVRVYPCGVYYTTITKCEYEYLIEIGVPVTILRALWVHVPRRIHPYRKIINALFSMKDSFKSTDPMMYHNIKVIMNGFYGKLAQVTEMPDGFLKAGSAWNPIHAAEITARTRIAVCRIQNALKEKCLAVHTDSVITTKKIFRSKHTKNRLGNFAFETEGHAILIACGMYQIGADPRGCAFKGFNPSPDETWRSILEKYHGYKRIPYWYNHVESWVEAMAKNHTIQDINVFSNVKKIIDLNCDSKRTWLKDFRAVDFLTHKEQSLPLFVSESAPPKFWKKI
jgi:hypothetical protein